MKQIFIFLFVIPLFLGVSQSVEAACILDKDWPTKGFCLDTVPGPSLFKQKIMWEKYFEYKGSEWMQMKKIEMENAISEGKFQEWKKIGSLEEGYTNRNVWNYYYLNGEAPFWNYQGINPQLEDYLCKKDQLIELNSSVEIHYNQPKYMCYHPKIKQIDVYVDALEDDFLSIDIPRNLVNPKDSFCNDSDFTILRNGERVDAVNFLSKQEFRSLKIKLEEDENLIEILEGTYSNSSKCDLENLSSFSPLKQLKQGIAPKDVLCRESWQIIFKSTDGSPACVKSKTIEKLIERGWAKEIPKIKPYIPNIGAVKLGDVNVLDCDTNGNFKEKSQCFMNSWNECNSAKISYRYITIEGDPIIETATIKKENADNCQMQIIHDATRDKWASEKILEFTCKNVTVDYEINHMIFENCSPSVHTITFRGPIPQPKFWHLGENLKVGNFFSYKICHVDLKECTDFRIDILVKDELKSGPKGKWLLETTVFDGNKIVKGEMELDKMSMELIGAQAQLYEYVSAFDKSVLWLSDYTSETDENNNKGPQKLKLDAVWGKAPIIGDENMQIAKKETIEIPSNVFETYVLTWRTSNLHQIWISDEIPFPVKAKVFEPVPEPAIAYEFELFSYHENGNPYKVRHVVPLE